MEDKELMIGDWVHIDSMSRVPPHNDKVRKIFEKYCDTDNSFIGWKYVEPIPLTDEILKENGFEKKQLDDSFIYSKEIGRYCIVFFSENGCPYLTIEDVEDIEQHHTCIELKDEVYNVHELQHALRLCGLHEMADNFKLK